MHDAFAVYMLSDAGKEKAQFISVAFDNLLTSLSGVVGEGRELALVKTKLEEACFFAKKGMAKHNSVPT